MEQSPIVGYLKVTFIGVLCFVIFLSVWSGEKTEEKIIRLDQSVQELETTVRDMSAKFVMQGKDLNKLAGANETLLKLLASGGVRAPVNGGGGAGPTVDIMGESKDAWGWKSNAALDASLDLERRSSARPGVTRTSCDSIRTATSTRHKAHPPTPPSHSIVPGAPSRAASTS